MASRSKIEWTGDTWPTVSGCEDASPGCAHCYAKRQAHRMAGNPHEKVAARYRGLTVLRDNGPQWTGAVRLLPEQLAVPLRQKAPRTIFVNSLSDTFHDDVPDDYIAAMFGVMMFAKRHTFQVLTKRAARMEAWFAWLEKHPHAVFEALEKYGVAEVSFGFGPFSCAASPRAAAAMVGGIPWPLENVHWGVSVEDIKHGVPRIAHLRGVPAALRFLSIEPQLEDLGELDLTGIGWVIVGGESGPGARRFSVEWARSIVAQCRAQRVPVFVKQLGARPVTHCGVATLPITLLDKKGGDPDEWPEDLRVRQMPEVARG